MKKKNKVAIYLTSAMILLSGCGAERKEIDYTNILNTNKSIEFAYGEENNNEEPNTNYKYSVDNVINKEFSEGTHFLVTKIAGSVKYDELINVKYPEGYKINDFSIIENATGESGFVYSAIVISFVNTSSVNAVGVLNQSTGKYEFRDFGEVITKPKTLTLE